ncbi:histone h1.3., putative [Talaromyces stipitatus ATCC 10500]|uniref:Histone h1.3., putative n=1 Tax=Talaromyces stipitatus (strain ATCC 10500 / CBS 375.48 / QM 6759 / NRRL 1006) TaxID=441959 RepID=B8M898_TALSN|nr:histone h1.3., putative [Talaromyces stipitatus ATCC 10500]EED20411.1 histone h1.3., putative [Talaromyces stipitatus ATCC 10500]
MSANDKNEVTINLSQSELKLIALGTRFSENGKVDYEKLAKYGGYTKGSAQVLYRKALRKLTDVYPIDADAMAGNGDAGSDPVTPTSKAKTPKTPNSRTSGKKRKDAAAAEDQDTTAAPQTPLGPTIDDAAGDALDAEMATSTKKPRKTSSKQATTNTFTPVNDPVNDDRFMKAEDAFDAFIKAED